VSDLYGRTDYEIHFWETVDCFFNKNADANSPKRLNNLILVGKISFGRFSLFGRFFGATNH
jgi:hypothetical protein